MKLLIITQKVDKNDSNLGFFLGWLEKFSQKLDKVLAVCLSEGEHTLPANVQVFNLGKDRGYSKLRQFCRLQKFLWRSLGKVDGVFYHMCPIFVLASFPWPQVFRKKQVLWFTHKSVNLKLWLAGKLVNKIVTASAKSCRLKNRKKIQVVGHGIDLDLFKPLFSHYEQSPELVEGRSEGSPKQGDSSARLRSLQNDKFQILTAGRISPSKDLKTLIEAVKVLCSRTDLEHSCQLTIIGEPVDQAGQEYLEELKQLVKEKNLENIIHFKGAVPYSQMPRQYQEANLFVNLSKTGSIDKAVLEAMASGCLVLTSNEAFQGFLPKEYLFQQGKAQELARKIQDLRSSPNSQQKALSLRQIVQKHHNLAHLIDKIVDLF